MGPRPIGIWPSVPPGRGLSPTLLVLAAPGGLQRPAVAALTVAALPVVVVNPRHASDVAKAPGQLATAAPRDARALAPLAEAIRPVPRPVPDAQPEAVRAPLARRRPRIAMRTAAQHRLGRASRRLHTDIEAHLTWLKARLVTLDEALETALRASP